MSQPESPAVDYVRILRRRKWIVLQMLLLGPLVAVVISLRQTPEYRASARVLVNLSGGGAGQAGSAAALEDPARAIENQAQVARTLSLVHQVVEASGSAFPSTTALLRHSSVLANEGVDLLTFSVDHRRPGVAVRVANDYASEFISYLQSGEKTSVRRSLAQVTAQLSLFQQEGDVPTPVLAALRAKQQQLQTLAAVVVPEASLVDAATGAEEVQPRLARNIALGVVLGLLLGLAAAFVEEMFDSRVRSEDEIVELLGAPLLARIAESSPAASGRLAMLEAPASSSAEGFRILRIALDRVLDRFGADSGRTWRQTRRRRNAARADASSLVITSAVDGEGKSTTISNLAVAYARAGRRVILVDYDLRYPSLERLFGLEGRPGVTDVVLDHVPLHEALAEIEIPNGAAGESLVVAGSLRILAAGPVSPELREAISVHALGELIEDLKQQADLVLVDAPPIVPVGDAQALVPFVDRVLVVLRSSFVRRRMLKELRRTLDLNGAPPVGLVLVVGNAEQREAYAGYYRSGYEPGRRGARSGSVARRSWRRWRLAP